MTSSTEATGIDAQAVVASLVAERREHAALAAASRVPAPTTDPPVDGETRTESPGGTADSTQEQEEAATATPAEPVGEVPVPAKENLTLPVVGETPLPEPEILELPVPEVPAPPLPALPDVPLP